MFRYLKEAFWARPALAGLGAIPWNVLAVLGVGMLGFAEHAIWLAGLGLETAYLYWVATNPRFQQWVDARDLDRIHFDSETSRQKLMQALAPAARQRLTALEEKISKIETLYRDSQNEDYLFDSNREALKKLTSLYLRLLVAERNIVLLPTNMTEGEIKKQIAAIETDLARKTSSTSLRESKRATLQLMKQRLVNFQRREETLAEIDSDLTRIEAQIDLAVEDASLKGRPTAISSNIELVSTLLDDTLGGGVTTTTTTTQSGAEVEN